MELRTRLRTQQPFRERFDCLIAFARGVLQGRKVDDLDTPAAVPDETGLLERIRHHRDAGAPNPEHLAEKLLRELQIVTALQVPAA